MLFSNFIHQQRFLVSFKFKLNNSFLKEKFIEDNDKHKMQGA